MGRTLHNRIIPGSGKGYFLLPDECGKRQDAPAQIYLNPTERTLYRLFLTHPEGIAASHLLAHWGELCALYAQESLYDEPELRKDKMESLCAENKVVFYSTVSRIKRKFTDALGTRRARAYIIRRRSDGKYYTAARLCSDDGSDISSSFFAILRYDDICRDRSGAAMVADDR